MKYLKILLGILAMLYTTGIYSQNVLKEDPLNGPKTEFYPNGKVSRQYTLTNGVVNGIYKAFSEKGFLLSEQNMVEGIPQGIYKTFYENGQVQTETNMENGVPQGVSKEYYENGTLKKDSYLVGDHPLEYTGKSSLYFENGSLKNETTVEHGKLVFSISYDIQGRVVMEESEGRNVSYSYDTDGTKHTYINGVEQK